MSRPLRQTAAGLRSAQAARSAGPDALRAELDQAQKRIAELEEALGRGARARTELIHLVAHELRTPITVVSGFARLLQGETAGPLGETQRRFVDECLKACRRLDRFVGDLLEAGAGTGSPLALCRAQAQLAPTLETTLEALGPMLAERGLSVDRRFDATLPDFSFDARRIEQVVTNLLTNAIRHGRPRGVIRISTERVVDPRSAVSAMRAGHAGARTASSVRVVVEDDGCGIPECDRERVFAPYVRGENHGEAGGLGIGLAICRRIVEAHGGAIHVEASELGGARFVFSLPLAMPSPSRADAGGEN